MKKNLVLLGMMAVGKSTIAKIVAKELKLKFIDTDKNIVKKTSMTIMDIFEKKGENFFRLEEEKEVLKCLNKNECIIAIGGGAFVNKLIRESVLKKSISIWLDLNLKTIALRTKWNNRRPLLKSNNNDKILKELYHQRKKFYKLADHKINCGKLNKNNLAKKIIELYEKYQNYN